MKIFHHVYNIRGYSGATEQALKLSKELVTKQDLDIIFVNSSSSESRSDDVNRNFGFSIIDLPRNTFLKLMFLIKLLISSDNKNALHHVHGFHFLEIILLVIFRRNILYKCTLEGKDDLRSIENSKFGCFKLFLLKKTNLINCLNPKILDINRNYCSSDKLIVIPNCVEIVSPKINSREMKIVYAGAIVKRKRALECIKYFHEKFSDLEFELLLVGPNDTSLPEFSETYYQKCLDYIEKNSINARFLGKVEHKDMVSIYQSSFAMLFFSEREGTPNVVLEAMSSNLPIICNEDDVIVRWLLGEEGYIDPRLCGDFLVRRISILRDSQVLIEKSKCFASDRISSITYNAYKRILEIK